MQHSHYDNQHSLNHHKSFETNKEVNLCSSISCSSAYESGSNVSSSSSTSLLSPLPITAQPPSSSRPSSISSNQTYSNKSELINHHYHQTVPSKVTIKLDHNWIANKHDCRRPSSMITTTTMTNSYAKTRTIRLRANDSSATSGGTNSLGFSIRGGMSRIAPMQHKHKLPCPINLNNFAPKYIYI